jgi:hypothetical protein
MAAALADVGNIPTCSRINPRPRTPSRPKPTLAARWRKAVSSKRRWFEVNGQHVHVFHGHQVVQVCRSAVRPLRDPHGAGAYVGFRRRGGRGRFGRRLGLGRCVGLCHRIGVHGRVGVGGRLGVSRRVRVGSRRRFDGRFRLHSRPGLVRRLRFRSGRRCRVASGSAVAVACGCAVGVTVAVGAGVCVAATASAVALSIPWPPSNTIMVAACKVSAGKQ